MTFSRAERYQKTHSCRHHNSQSIIRTARVRHTISPHLVRTLLGAEQCRQSQTAVKPCWTNTSLSIALDRSNRRPKNGDTLSRQMDWSLQYATGEPPNQFILGVCIAKTLLLSAVRWFVLCPMMTLFQPQYVCQTVMTCRFNIADGNRSSAVQVSETCHSTTFKH